MGEPTSPRGAAAESALYRRVWRWHFYAGLICLPFLVLLAITGGLYLFKDAIEARLYARLQVADAGPTRASGAATAPTPEALVAKALAAAPGVPARFVAPSGPGRSAEVGVRSGGGVVAVYLDPADGRVLGTLRDDERLMELVKRIHSLAIAGPLANHWIEIVAGWAIVLVVSGVFLWWPRGRAGGVYSVRERPAQRLWWRDLHAVTGITAALAIVFLAVTGMPWSAFWGEQFGRISSAWGLGVPAHVWGPAPESAAPPLAGLQQVPWAIGQVPPPRSTAPHGAHAAQATASHGGHPAPGEHAAQGEHGERAGHRAHGELAGHGAPARPAAGAAWAAEGAGGIGLDQAMRLFAQRGLPAGTPVHLPEGPRGVYSATRFPDDVRDVRVVHLDRYSGAVLADIGHDDYGLVGRATEWGISIHTGRQFGWVNQLVMLAACLSIIALAVSAAVMWWKRRPRGRLAAPPRRAGDRAAAGAIAVAVLLGLVYPLLGASMLVVLAADAVVPASWRGRFGL